MDGSGRERGGASVDISWERDHSVRVRMEAGAVVLSANRAGLLSLARHLRALADAETGDHIHYDEYNSLETGSLELIVEKTAPEA